MTNAALSGTKNGTCADSYTVSETCVNKTLYFQKNGEKFSISVSVSIDKTAPAGRVTVGTHYTNRSRSLIGQVRFLAFIPLNSALESDGQAVF